MNTKRWTALFLAAVMALALAACADTNAKKNETDTTDPAEKPSASEQIVSPWQEYGSLEDAVKAAGFELALPEDAPDGALIQVIENEIIEVSYTKDGSQYVIRKGVGSGDVSGDYSSYAETSTVTVADNEVTVKGGGGLVSLAIWTAGDYSYSVSAEGGISLGEMTALITAVK